MAARARAPDPFKASMPTPSNPVRHLLHSNTFDFALVSGTIADQIRESERVDLTAERLELLKRINHRVNSSIVAKPKAYAAI